MTEIETFQLPVFYNENKKNISPSIRKDLELAHTENEELDLNVNKESNDSLEKEQPVYHHLFNINFKNSSTVKKEYLNKMVEKMTEYYTTDVAFLKDSQELLKNYRPYEKETFHVDSIIETWREIKNDTGFKEKYYYVDWPIWEFLNNSEWFLLIMSIYNLSAPVLSLLLPIFILIFPFFIIKMRGMDVTMNEYITILKILASNHTFGKLFTEFHSVELNQKIYLIVSALFYIFSIYQNFLLCIRFHMNTGKIHDTLQNLKKYIGYTTNKIDHYLSFGQDKSTHQGFHQVLQERKNQLKELEKKWDRISPYPFSFLSVGSWNTFFETGYKLKCFYELYDDPSYHELMEYTFEFHAYLECIDGLTKNISQEQMGFAEFDERVENEQENRKENRKKDKKEKGKKNRKEKGQKNKRETKDFFQNNYYAVLKDRNPVKNTVSFDKNIIITGPNASGKTTVLKSILINLLFTQQWGCGCYDSAFVKPYHFIHCYLNIPDTSGRDSLFQAEAKRCKQILDSVESNKSEERHFCAFDEIYSGTNPEEATLSTVAFINYLVKYSNVSCILTSHFLKACKKLGKNEKIKNCHMSVQVEKGKDDSGIQYTYQLEKGISAVRGGIQILKEMNYPQKILDDTIR
jgi:hypothetical protein